MTLELVVNNDDVEFLAKERVIQVAHTYSSIYDFAEEQPEMYQKAIDEDFKGECAFTQRVSFWRKFMVEEYRSLFTSDEEFITVACKDKYLHKAVQRLGWYNVDKINIPK